jgi:enediyne polyketide synthase
MDRADFDGRVAIIGLACRFPGAAQPAEFHDLTVAGRRMFRPVAGSPAGPLRAALLDDWGGPADWSGPGDWGGPADWSGPGDWGGPAGRPAVAPAAGAVQKLAAETTALALADAGLRAEEIGTTARGRAGTFIASSVPGVGELVHEQSGLTGDAARPLAAAFSSLHAVAAAVHALRRGDLDLAVAGGAELGLDPAWLAAQARAGTLGRDEMHVYAADPCGLLPGEGCGAAVLVRSADARAAGVPIYAEITGCSTVPVSGSGLDDRAIRYAYQQAGVDPADIQLVEGQGTGTAAGDLAELTAFARLRHGGRATAALGAVAADIGYSRAAAGIASLIKTALAMAVGTIPPGTRCARQHRLIETGNALLRLPRAAEPWPDGSTDSSGRRLAAVNSLGTADPAGGPGRPGPDGPEGVHLVLCREAEAERRRGRRRRAAETGTAEAGTAVRPKPERVVPVAYEVRPAGFGTAFRAGTGNAPEGWPADAAGAGRTGPPRAGAAGVAGDEESRGQACVVVLCGWDRGQLAARLEVIASWAAGMPAGDLPELAGQLAAAAHRAGDRAGPVRVALTVNAPGQLTERARRAARLLSAELNDTGVAADGPDVWVSAGARGRVAVLFGGLAAAGLAPPGRLAAALGGLRALEQLGVRPAAALGYSLGELAGLVWAGCLPAAEAARLAAQCGQVLRGYGGGPAAMARVAAGAGLARDLAAIEGLHIAAYEGPRSHLLAGPAGRVRRMSRRAAAAGVEVDLLSVPHALHSPAMAGCTAPLRSVLAAARFAPPRRRLVSSVTGRLVLPGDNVAELLAGQLSRPVLFGAAMAELAGQADLAVVAGADDGLAELAAGCAMPAAAVPAGPVPGWLDRDETAPFRGRGAAGGHDAGYARLAAALFAAGAISDVTALAPPVPARTWSVPRMRPAERGHGQAARLRTGAAGTARSGPES